MALRTVLYVRYSSEMTARNGGVSTADQIKKLRAEARENGEIIIAELEDQARSGAEMVNRPAFQEALRLARDVGYDLLRIESVDRGNRNELDRRLMERELQRYNVEILYLGESIDQPDSDRAFSRGIKGVMSEYYRIDVGNKQYSRGKYKAEQGKWRGGRIPYGLTPTEDGWFEKDPETYPFLVFMFEKRAAGWGHPRIAGALNRGVSINGEAPVRPPTPTVLEYRRRPYKDRIDKETGETVQEAKPIPTEFWNGNTVMRICRQAIDGVYAGVLHWGHRHKRERDAQGRKKQPVRFEGHPPLVDENLLAAVAAVEENSKGKRRGGPPPSYVVKPTCGVCGGPMAFNTRRNTWTGKKDGIVHEYYYRYFVCTKWHTSYGTACTAKPIDAEHVERETLRQVRQYLEGQDPSKLSAEWEEGLASIEREFSELIRMATTEIEEQKAIKEGQLRIMMQLTPDDLLWDEVKQRAEDTVRRLKALEIEKAKFERGMRKLRDRSGELNYSVIEPLLKPELWEDPDQKDALRRMLAEMVEVVKAYPSEDGSRFGRVEVIMKPPTALFL